MRKSIFVLLFHFVVSIYAVEAKPNRQKPLCLHAILVADTKDSRIGGACMIDMYRWEIFLRTVAEDLGWQLNLRRFIGKDLVLSDVVNYVSQIPSTPKDSIFFCYSGHGQNFERLFPAACFTREGRIYPAVDVQKTLEGKPHRTLVTVFDCCNTIPEKPQSKYESKNFEETLVMRHNAKTLFRNFSGSIVVAAAGVGYQAQATRQDGSCFSRSLIRILHEQRLGSWEHAMEVLQQEDREKREWQFPMYQITRK